MVEYKPEGLCRPACELSSAQLAQALTRGEVMQATALAFDRQQRLRLDLNGQPAYMEHDDCADGIDSGQVREIAVLTRVGRPTCFMITGAPGADGAWRLSRRLAQRRCREEYLDRLQPGDILPCRVTHIESFGAFCDVGCGISALLPIDCLSVSRIQSPADRVQLEEDLFCVIKSRDEQGRLVLSLRELLGTWQENAGRFAVGETVVGIVRSIEDYGVFIEIAPNLAGLAERTEGLRLGQPVSVYIKSILPDKMKLKLVIVNRELSEPLRFALPYTQTEGHIDRWVYSTPFSRKHIETEFETEARAAAGPCAGEQILL